MSDRVITDPDNLREYAISALRYHCAEQGQCRDLRDGCNCSPEDLLRRELAALSPSEGKGEPVGDTITLSEARETIREVCHNLMQMADEVKDKFVGEYGDGYRHAITTIADAMLDAVASPTGGDLERDAGRAAGLGEAREIVAASQEECKDFPDLWNRHNVLLDRIDYAFGAGVHADWRAMFFWPDAKRRLWFISDCLARNGQVNRADICEAFGVSVPQASTDLREWQRLHPGAVEYDKSAKTYKVAALRSLQGGGE